MRRRGRKGRRGREEEARKKKRKEDSKCEHTKKTVCCVFLRAVRAARVKGRQSTIVG